MEYKLSKTGYKWRKEFINRGNSIKKWNKNGVKHGVKMQ